MSRPSTGPSASRIRFDVLFMVRSLGKKHRIRVRTQIPDGEVADALQACGGADWAEREVWDMFGIDFDGHPDMRRILMYDEFVGHPLRKDYPIEKACSRSWSTAKWTASRSFRPSA
jgi:NADH-quinone oxidoreductase subunit C